MYGESSFTWEYVCGYETREQRKRRLLRRTYGLSATLCIVSLTAMLSVKIASAGGVRYLTEKFWNTEKEAAADLPFTGEGIETIQEETAVPLPVVTEQMAVPAGNEIGRAHV